MNDPTIYGVAVNDWFGPFSRSETLTQETRDSGKTIVLAKEATLESFRTGVEAGAMLAVKDLGAVKDQVPVIHSIDLNADIVTIQTNGNVTWISNGEVVGTGKSYNVTELSFHSRYLRAEITNTEGSTVYTQAWGVQAEPLLLFLATIKEWMTRLVNENIHISADMYNPTIPK
ncbi:MAG: hypothetical protein O7D86_08320 [Proteobacteria bacterium]|nr:hypothetical protein [Pseudomonadota bacterium]